MSAGANGMTWLRVGHPWWPRLIHMAVITGFLEHQERIGPVCKRVSSLYLLLTLWPSHMAKPRLRGWRNRHHLLKREMEESHCRRACQGRQGFVAILVMYCEKVLLFCGFLNVQHHLAVRNVGSGVRPTRVQTPLHHLLPSTLWLRARG